MAANQYPKDSAGPYDTFWPWSTEKSKEFDKENPDYHEYYPYGATVYKDPKLGHDDSWKKDLETERPSAFQNSISGLELDQTLITWATQYRERLTELRMGNLGSLKEKLTDTERRDPDLRQFRWAWRQRESERAKEQERKKRQEEEYMKDQV